MGKEGFAAGGQSWGWAGQSPTSVMVSHGVLLPRKGSPFCSPPGFCIQCLALCVLKALLQAPCMDLGATHSLPRYGSCL